MWCLSVGIAVSLCTIWSSAIDQTDFTGDRSTASAVVRLIALILNIYGKPHHGFQFLRYVASANNKHRDESRLS